MLGFDMWKEHKGIRNIFEYLNREFADAESLLDKTFGTLQESGDDKKPTLPYYYYGYQLSVGPDGIPHVKEFGDVKPLTQRPGPSGSKEPLVDKSVDKKRNILRITAEMPGLNKQDIKVQVQEGLVSIHAEKGEKKYHTELPVEHRLDENSVKATYVNGILELNFKISEQAKPKRKEVKVD
jgi:HSP20 family protein